MAASPGLFAVGGAPAQLRWLAGLSLYPQGIVVSPGANPTGVVVSNAGDIRFGAR